jgi:anti-sigma B factor antagonist/stage II sporulation protein AA (anti-sigma F factor antagonist)
MDWSTERRGEAVVGRVAGKVDESNWQLFAEKLTQAVSEAVAAGAKKLVLDLGGLDYMSSRGLRALTSGTREAKAASVTVILAAPNALVREILEISRYDKLFRVEGSVEAAL